MDSRTRSMIRNLEVRKKVTRLKQEKKKYTKEERNMILKVDRIRFSKLSLTQKLTLSNVSSNGYATLTSFACSLCSLRYFFSDNKYVIIIWIFIRFRVHRRGHRYEW